jgi:hypothetical protein
MRRTEEKIPLGRHTHRWEDNIKMDHRETERGGMDWTHLAQDGYQWKAFVGMVMSIRVSQNVQTFLS